MNPHKLERWVGIGLLIATAAFAVFFWCTGFYGFWGADDLQYAMHAVALTRDRFQPSLDLYAFRWAVVFPLALSFLCFGVNDFGAAVPALLVTMATAVLVWTACDGVRFVYRAAAVFVFMLQLWTLFNGVTMMPDAPVALGFMLAWFALFRLRFRGVGDWNACILFSAGLWLAAFSKESFILFLPFFAALFVWDLAAKRRLGFWTKAIGVNALAMALYLVALYGITGSAFTRWNALVAGSYVNPCRYDLLPFANTLRRVGFELWKVWLDTGQLACVVFLFPLYSHRSGERSFIFWSCVCCLLLANFTTISLSHYVPMCPDPRHFLYLAPLLAIATAYGLQASRRRSVANMLACAACAVSVWAAFRYADTTYSAPLWLGLSVSCVVLLTVRDALYKAALVSVVLLAGFLGMDRLWYRYQRSTGYYDQRKVAKELIARSNRPTRVFTDIVESRYGMFYAAFDSTVVRFDPYSLYAPFKSDTAVFVLSNPFTAWMSQNNSGALPDSVNRLLTDERVVNRVGETRLYRIQ